MSEMNRRSLLVGGVSFGLGMPAIIGSKQAWAAALRLKYGESQVESYPHTVHMREAAARIKEESNGEVTLDVFPSSQLGSDTDMLSQVRSGALEFMTISGLILSTLVPATAIHGIAYAWRGNDNVWAAMDGDLGRYEREQIAQKGLMAFDTIWDSGFRQITSGRKPIASPDDMKGFKIRVPVSPMWTSLFQALGASPVSLNFNEVYTSLQTQVVDGQENGLVLIDANKLYEVQKFLSITNHMWDGTWLISGQRTWSRLPADAQQLLTKHFEQAAKANRTDIAKLNGDLETQLAGEGMTVNKVDPDPFRARLQQTGFFKDWKDKFGADAWGILEKYAGQIT